MIAFEGTQDKLWHQEAKWAKLADWKHNKVKEPTCLFLFLSVEDKSWTAYLVWLKPQNSTATIPKDKKNAGQLMKN